MKILKEIDKHVFTPHNSLDNWMRTHKRPYSIAGLQMPGLFNSDKYNFHLIMFLLALSVEIFGALFLALPFGADLGTTGAMVGSIGFVLDFGIAFILLFSNSNLCYFKNLLILYASNAGSSAAIGDKVKSIYSTKRLGYTVILLIAVLKICVLVNGWGSADIPMTIYVLSFLFLVTAIIHIRYTEFFFAFYGKFLPAASQDKNDYIIVTGRTAQPQEIYTTTKLQKFDAIQDSCLHSIEPTDIKIKIKNSIGVIEDRYKSIIYISGLITDNDAEILCRSQPGDTGKRDLGVELLALQLNYVTPSERLQNFVNSLPKHRILIP